MSNRKGLNTLLQYQFNVTPFQLLQAKAFDNNMKAVDLEQHPPRPEAVALLSGEIARRHGVVPVVIMTGGLVIALPEAPLRPGALEEIEAACGLKVLPVLAHAESVAEALARCYPEAG
ncbi:MAG TPA: hypothetical protein VK689_08940 [Armatimonadota bacterium]|nr:hypothetical protein [Armatimonadota bacterium]